MRYYWEKFTDEQILALRIKDLKLEIKNSPIEPLIDRLYSELEAKNLIFKPPCYLADEWLSPDKIPIIGIPFYLAHSKLKKIEKKIMLEAEGESEKKFMKLIRHECGHAINYAYQLYRRTRWRQLFGNFSEPYNNYYSYLPYSKKFVPHLADNYAQSHPDDDFAETFAVWLDAKNNWQQKYRNWPVIWKLNYVNSLMKKITATKPIITAGSQRPWAAAKMTSTLSSYYERKKKQLGTAFGGYYDDNLKRLFPPNEDTESIKASQFIKSHRRQIIDNITKWTGHRKFDISQLLSTFIKRCDAMKLSTQDNAQQLIALTSLLTAIANNTARIRK